MMAAGFGEFHLTAECTVFMDNWRIEGGGGGERREEELRHKGVV